MGKAHMLRILLIGQVQREKHAKKIYDMKSKLATAQELLSKCQETTMTLV